VHLVTYRAVLYRIARWQASGRRRYIVLTNPHSIMSCIRNDAMHAATNGAALTLPDGIGVLWAARILRCPQHGRITGPTLMLKMCDWGRQYGMRHFFYGGSPGVSKTLATRMVKRFPGLQIAGFYSPPFREMTAEEDETCIRAINDSRPDIVWVGLGAPRQEIWMARHVDRIVAHALIGVGAAFDFHSGNVRWAPEWVRRIGLEWLHRLATEPRRLWKRNLDSPLFMSSVVLQLLRQYWRYWIARSSSQSSPSMPTGSRL
jgi:N-acetylglucosaminyldiphosphoundecaprenol N-acetyl-beta-D-mannosaminyltransferase